jgi:hypothetical protein
MRKVLVALVTCLLLSTFNSATAGPHAFTWSEQMAFADWIEMHGKKGTYTGMIGARIIHPDFGVITLGAVARGTCRKSGSRRFTVIDCRGRGVAKEIPFGDFSMDPAMETASVGRQRPNTG